METSSTDRATDPEPSSACLRIASRLRSAAEISSVLAIAPTGVYPQGEPIGRSGKPRQESVWLLRSTLPEEEPLQNHIANILGRIADKRDALGLLKPDCDPEIVCSYSTTSGQGGFFLQTDLMEACVNLHLDLVFDIYHIGPDVNES